MGNFYLFSPLYRFRRFRAPILWCGLLGLTLLVGMQPNTAGSCPNVLPGPSSVGFQDYTGGIKVRATFTRQPNKYCWESKRKHETGCGDNCDTDFVTVENDCITTTSHYTEGTQYFYWSDLEAGEGVGGRFKIRVNAHHTGCGLVSSWSAWANSSYSRD